MNSYRIKLRHDLFEELDGRGYSNRMRGTVQCTNIKEHSEIVKYDWWMLH